MSLSGVGLPIWQLPQIGRRRPTAPKILAVRNLNPDNSLGTDVALPTFMDDPFAKNG
jgi:hypothetical protein